MAEVITYSLSRTRFIWLIVMYPFHFAPDPSNVAGVCNFNVIQKCTKLKQYSLKTCKMVLKQM